MLKNNLKLFFRNIRRNKGTFLINTLGLGIGIASFLVLVIYVYNDLSPDDEEDRTTQRVMTIDQYLDELKKYYGESKLEKFKTTLTGSNTATSCFHLLARDASRSVQSLLLKFDGINCSTSRWKCLSPIALTCTVSAHRLSGTGSSAASRRLI